MDYPTVHIRARELKKGDVIVHPRPNGKAVYSAISGSKITHDGDLLVWRAGSSATRHMDPASRITIIDRPYMLLLRGFRELYKSDD